MEYKRFGLKGEYLAGLKHPLWRGGKHAANFCVFDTFQGKVFERWAEKTNRKGQVKRGKTIKFNYIGSVEVPDEVEETLAPDTPEDEIEPTEVTPE